MKDLEFKETKCNIKYNKIGEKNMRLILLVTLILGTTLSIYADYRYYAWTYQFMTMIPGQAELELYTRFDQKDFSISSTGKWKRQIEVEMGLTKNWDFSFYLVDGYNPSDGKTKFEEVKLRTRYKILEKDTFFIDPLVYIEYKIQADRSYPDKWEFKLIFAKDFENFNIALNIIPKEYYKSGTKEKDWKLEYSTGISYAIISDAIRLGIETKGDFKEEKYYLGPTFAAKGKNVWSAVGIMFGLNDKSDNFQTQIILGMLF